MNIHNWLTVNTAALENAGISTARLDCLVLLSDTLSKDKAWLLSHPEHELQGSEIEILNNKVAQRAKHIPLAYIRGKAEFYGREFAVNAHTLVPRPETETMIDLLKRIVIPASEPESKNKKWIPGQARNDSEITIVDIGTGSGAIAVTAKLELPNAKVIATDIDEDCLQTAEANATKLGADITFLRGDLLEPLFENAERRTKNVEPNTEKQTLSVRHSAFDVLLCNLPYVPDNFQINTAATHEPRHALFGGPDGLGLYRKLFTQTTNLSRPPAFILTESLPPQHETLTAIAKAAGYSLEQTDDFIQLFYSN